MLFSHYISERISYRVNEIHAEGEETDFNYAQMDDGQAEMPSW